METSVKTAFSVSLIENFKFNQFGKMALSTDSINNDGGRISLALPQF